jgi:hypothetical protein
VVVTSAKPNTENITYLYTLLLLVSRFPIYISFKRNLFFTNFYKKATLSIRSERVAFHLMDERKKELFKALCELLFLQ